MLRLYCRYFSIQLKSALEYKVSFLLTALGQFFVSFAGFLSVYFMFQQFHAVKASHTSRSSCVFPLYCPPFP